MRTARVPVTADHDPRESEGSRMWKRQPGPPPGLRGGDPAL